MPSTDPEFIRYATTGDGDAFRALVSAHLGMVIAVAVRRLGPHAHLAPDVAQGVFTRLARVARGLPRDLIVAPWLHRQAVRLAIDAVRKEERRLRRETTAAMLHAPDSTPPPAETALLLDEALDQLPAADRTVLVLRYLEDRDFESVAQSLGSTPEAARKRIARSLEKLRALLTRRGVALTAAGLSGFLSTQSTQAAAPAALSARISASALKSAAATGNTAAILTTALMSHATALTTGALAALLACGLFYQQREKEIARRPGVPAEASVAPQQRSDGSVRSDGSSTSDPLPSTLPEIIAAIATLTDGPNTRAASQRIAALLRRVPPEQYLEFYTTAEPRIHPLRWHAVVEHSIPIWQDQAPDALVMALVDSDNRKANLLRIARLQHNMMLNSVELQTGRDGGASFAIRMEGAYAKWVAMDMPAARKWLHQIKTTPLMQLSPAHSDGKPLYYGLASTVAQRLASKGSLRELQDFMAGAPASELGIMQESWAIGRLETAGGLSAALASASDAREVQVLTREYVKSHPEECRRWIAGDANADALFAAALGMIGEFEHEVDGRVHLTEVPERLSRARLALEVSGSASSSAALRSIVDAWLESVGHGTDELRTWVLEAGGTENAGDALAAGATRLAGQSSSSPQALQWAAAIPDAAQRGPLLRGIYLRWQDADPAAAQKFLTSAPADIAAELQALTPEAP